VPTSRPSSPDIVSVRAWRIPAGDRCLPLPRVHEEHRRRIRSGEVMSFSELGLAAPLLDALSTAGYDQPTPVQTAAIPLALAGTDLLVSSQTGSGKTAAFMLPSLQRLLVAPVRPGKGPRVLVLTPTRELAIQVHRAAGE